ncbi:hypothetical protein [Rhizobium sp. YTU87027]|uniref:phosphorylase family protein n=1 Tax=Rhizobium sp. YTU87027 TaxID=3417741 RepID=UPI003D69946D
MKILIIEDDDKKFGAVSEVVSNYFKGSIETLVRSIDLSSATKQIYEQKFDLIITDLSLPPRHPEPGVDLSDELAATIHDSSHNKGTSVIALSGFSEIVGERRRYFSDAGIFLVEYGADGKWVQALEMCLQRVAVKFRYDFIIFCALEKERNAFKAAAGCSFGETFIARGLNCVPLTIGDRRGLCIKMPRAGLVDAAITAAKAIELYSPKIVAMSGICAGVNGESSIGSLIVASFTWEYQVGKFHSDEFKIEPYQVHINPTELQELENFIQKDKVGLSYKDNTFSDQSILYQPLVLGPVASGSAVIADPAKINTISKQHRKMAAIDMEMHAIYRACDLAPERPRFFGAKTVVDMADQHKGDQHHVNGSIVSARFTVSLMAELLRRL